MLQTMPHRQTEQTLALASRVCILPMKTRVKEASRSVVQGDIVKYGHHAEIGFQLLDQLGPLLQIFDLYVEHMRVMAAVVRHCRRLDRRKILQSIVILSPVIEPGALQFFRFLQLAPQICGLQLAREVAAADVDPCIFVDLPPVDSRARRNG
jgi:hypothetical protein